jgi:hypothetical protein
MKNLQFIKISFLLLGLVLFASCSKDKDAGPSTNITYDGAAFNVTTVTLVGVSSQGDGHAALSFINVNGTSSKTLTIDVEYAKGVSLSGTYAFPQTAGTLYLDDFLTNYTEMSTTTMNFTETSLQSGTVTLKDNGNANYAVTFDFTMENGKIFKGTYSGKVQANLQ